MQQPGFIVDLSGQLTITSGIYAPASANIVTDRNGVTRGLYLDDTTPDLDKWVAIALANVNGWFVLVAIGPDQFGQRHPGAHCLFEVYWVGTGWTIRTYFRERLKRKGKRYAGYIVQHKYGGPGTGLRVPTEKQYQRSVRLLQSLKPELGIWAY